MTTFGSHHVPKHTIAFEMATIKFILGTISCVLLTSVMSVNSYGAQPTATTANYGDWTVRCRAILTSAKTPDDSEKSKNLKNTPKLAETVCEMAQVIKVRQKDRPPQVVAQIAMGRLAKLTKADTSTPMKLVFQVPAGVYLREPVELGMDADKSGNTKAEKSISASYIRCLRGFCLADINLMADQITILKMAKTAQLGFVDAARRKIKLPVSLKGFSDAFEAIQKKQ